VWAAAWVRAPGTLWVMQHHHDLGELLEGQPEPHRVGPSAEPTPQFVQLDVREVQPLSDALVQRRAVRARVHHPSRDRGMAMAEHAHGRGHAQPFGQRRQYFGNAVGGGFEPIERGHPEGTRGACAIVPQGRAAQGLSALVSPMSAITEAGMDARIGDLIGRYRRDWDMQIPGSQCGPWRRAGFCVRARASRGCGSADGWRRSLPPADTLGNRLIVRGRVPSGRSRSRAAVTLAVRWCGHTCGQCQSSQSSTMLNTSQGQNQSTNISFLVTWERDHTGA
jgi:hypothetical protein